MTMPVQPRAILRYCFLPSAMCPCLHPNPTHIPPTHSTSLTQAPGIPSPHGGSPSLAIFGVQLAYDWQLLAARPRNPYTLTQSPLAK